MRSKYPDRRAAGQALAARLSHCAHLPGALVLALPRGGVPVAHEVARELGLPLDVFIVRKLGVPGHEELAMGAIASGGVRVLNRQVIDDLGLPEAAIEAVTAAELAELQRRERLYRAQRPPLDLLGRTVILVDDGLATGSTMRAAVAAVREQGAARVIVAVPVAPPDTCDTLARQADEVICPLRPHNFEAVGQWYEDFAQTTDDEVSALLASAGS
ncbi:MAG TPA: phosphoribosyltransferase [Verrucomicrobiae bacterium]|nr:phosphoribosyltransferase [Verrucomicrobiae bacterium]